MNYYAARKLTDVDLWHYTCRNDSRIWPVGYCSRIQACAECNPYGQPEPLCHVCAGKGYIEVDNPCAGHATAEEAQEHMRQYLVDTGIKLNATTWANSQHRCEVEGCEAWTQKAAMVVGLGMPHYTDLCEEHMTREVMAGMIQVGMAVSS